MKLNRVPLRIKLVALVMLLLTFAIVLIGVASNLAIGRYLTDKVDSDLLAAAGQLQQAPPAVISSTQKLPLPSDYIIIYPNPGSEWHFSAYSGLPENERPVFTENAEALGKSLGEYRIVYSQDRKHKWRMMISAFSDGRLFLVAKSTNEVDGLKKRVLQTTIYGGAAALIMAASLGTDLVRRSLRPLATIERTAGAIAGGDLTRRVPDPEEGAEEPKTEVGSLARSLNAMLTQIEQAFTSSHESENRALRSEEKMRQFVADASHELRTPLTTIRGFAELYRQGAVGSPEDTAALVKRIEDEARRMGLLVEDLLLLARMEQERPVRALPVELRVLAIEAVQAAQVLAPDREITLSVAPDSGELIVLGDDARLRQVINNLMGNALAHTPQGTPVEVRLYRDADEAVLEVADHGPGLSPEQTDRVFERFYRADAARTRRADGHVSTGLGLAIVAALVAAHNGKVEVQSTPEQGATFIVRLPIDAAVDESL
ncbi:sensor histidine kinase [Catelliglobosispora koreensis]|uniref:sensor histidine kinase n=1 Tax=Catelliglobosispora koreensis TaxID=129052 RepID=UPI0003715975|nr:HAMP domain-containing sensor histidine kinase [Catelliglobosispora koreensis]